MDRYIHVLEPVHVVSTFFGEALKSANQMISNPNSSNSFTTTNMFMNQLKLFKQQHNANRQAVSVEKKEEVVDTAELPERDEVEKEHEERMRKIREEMNSRFSKRD